MKSKILVTIKKLFLEFIVIVFLIGFFSSSFVNYTVPRVNSTLAYAGTIEKTFPVEGRIEYKHINKVRLGSNVVIEENYAEVGRRVEEGEKIFKINLNYGIEDIQRELSALENELQKEAYKLQRLQQNNYLVDQKRIDIVKKNIEREEEGLLKLKELYEAGAIPLEEVEEHQYQIEMLQENLYLEKLRLEEVELERVFAIQEVERRMEEIYSEIEEKRSQGTFYSKASDNGVYYAEVPGIITKISPLNHVLSPDEPVVEIAMMEEAVTDFIFTGYLPEKYGRYFDIGDILEVELNHVRDEVRFKIDHMYFVEERNAFKVEGELMREVPDEVLLHRNYEGAIKRRERAEYIIPKAAMITSEFIEGGTGVVYVIESIEGVLGRQHIAREVEVTITAVGDKVSVEGLEAFQEARVITTISHRIKDGVKVAYGS